MMSKKSICTCFILMSATSFALIYLTPPSTNVLFPAFQHVRDTGTYPDGLAVRRTYTGIAALDEIFTGLAGFFGAVVDGHDEMTRMFCLWFLPQLCSILVFLYWEAGRAERNAITHPTTFSILAQLITAGVVLPLYFALHVSLVPSIPTLHKPSSPLRARVLLPAIIPGFLIPSAMLFLSPANSVTSINTKQIVAAFWQPFPIYLALIYNLLSRVFSATYPSENTSSREGSFASIDSHLKQTRANAFHHVKYAYLFSGTLSALAHWLIVLPSLFGSDPSYSFAQIFIPYPLHSSLGVAPSEVAPYRLSIRLLFQNDWLTMTVAALVFFGWMHAQLVSQTNVQCVGDAMRAWSSKMITLTVLGGPGAAIAWAALQREKLILIATAKQGLTRDVNDSKK